MDAENNQPVQDVPPEEGRQHRATPGHRHDVLKPIRSEIPEHLFSEPTLPRRQTVKPQRT